MHKEDSEAERQYPESNFVRYSNSSFRVPRAETAPAFVFSCDSDWSTSSTSNMLPLESFQVMRRAGAPPVAEKDRRDNPCNTSSLSAACVRDRSFLVVPGRLRVVRHGVERKANLRGVSSGEPDKPCYTNNQTTFIPCRKCLCARASCLTFPCYLYLHLRVL